MNSYPLTKNQQEACIEAIKQIVAIWMMKVIMVMPK